MFWQISQNSEWNTCVRIIIFYNEFADLKRAILSKKGTGTSSFLWIFAEFVRTGLQNTDMLRTQSDICDETFCENSVSFCKKSSIQKKISYQKNISRELALNFDQWKHFPKSISQ